MSSDSFKDWNKKNSRCESVDHVCIFKNNQIQPTAASLSACSHAHLMTSGL